VDKYNQEYKDLLKFVTLNVYHQEMANTIQNELMKTKREEDLDVFQKLHQLKKSYNVKSWQELYLKFISYHHDKEVYYQKRLEKNLDLLYLVSENINDHLNTWIRLNRNYGGEPRKPFEIKFHLKSLSHISVKKGFHLCFNIFLESSDKKLTIIKSSLHIAAENHQYKMVKELLEKIESPHDIIDQDALLSWSIEHNDVDILRRLLTLGISPNRHKKNVRAPLALATFKENVEMIRILLEYDADVNILGCYPLICAIGKNNIDIVQVLVESHKIKKRYLEKAIQVASKNVVNQKMVALLEQEIVKAQI
jgi:hypothetical protein